MNEAKRIPRKLKKRILKNLSARLFMDHTNRTPAHKRMKGLLKKYNIKILKANGDGYWVLSPYIDCFF